LAVPTIPDRLAGALAERGYTDLTPVQLAVIAPEAAGRDLLVSAQTGSGKTVAFGLGMGETLLDGAEEFAPAGDPLALVVAPTRELALQVQRELEWLYAGARGRVVACVGGMDPRRERRLLEAGAHLVVGTPGRLKDHIERGALRLAAVRAVVLDEADEMLDLGFREDLAFILEATPESRRTMLFSATLPKAIVALAAKHQKDAHRIAAGGGERAHADIAYRAVRVQPREVEHAVVNLLRELESPASIVFCNTRDGVRRLHATLLERGFSAVYLSGELGQGERNQALQALRDGRARVCVATDVAARGIDLPNLALVIHADLPLNAEILQHRSGRTGRAGRKGVSALIVPHSRRRKAEQLIAEARLKPVWTDPPTADDIRQLDRQRFLVDPLLNEELLDEDRAMGRLLLAQKAPDDIAALLAKLYRSRLPEPEELSEPEPMHAAWDRGQRRDPGFEPRAPRERSIRDDAPTRERSDGVIFRMDVGRRNKADPKWLLPMICRRGAVNRNEIGAIRIFEDTTEFEVSRAAAEHFAVNARRRDGEDITIAPASEERPRHEGHRRERAPKPAFKPRTDRAPEGAPPDMRQTGRSEKRAGPRPAEPGAKGVKHQARSGFAHRKKPKG